MGFDDIIFDNEIIAGTIDNLKPLVGRYNYEDWEDLEGMETGPKVYCAYSLLFRQLWAVHIVMLTGMCPTGEPTPEMLARLTLSNRKACLEIFIDEIDNEEVLEKILPVYEKTIEAYKASGGQQ